MFSKYKYEEEMITMSGITVSTASPAVSRGQVKGMSDLIRASISGSGVPGPKLKRMLCSEQELRISSRFTDLIVEMAEQLPDSFLIPVNYDRKEAIATAIKRNRFGYEHVDKEVGDIPLVGKGKVLHEVFEYPFERRIDLTDVAREVDAHSYALVDPLTSLRYAELLPDRQTKYLLNTLFTNEKGQICLVNLSSSFGERGVSVYRASSGARFDKGDKVLVIPKTCFAPV
jgi:hypothetical protein